MVCAGTGSGGTLQRQDSRHSLIAAGILNLMEAMSRGGISFKAPGCSGPKHWSSRRAGAKSAISAMHMSLAGILAILAGTPPLAVLVPSMCLLLLPPFDSMSNEQPDIDPTLVGPTLNGALKFSEICPGALRHMHAWGCPAWGHPAWYHIQPGRLTAC